jgi:hypothetical protein
MKTSLLARTGQNEVEEVGVYGCADDKFDDNVEGSCPDYKIQSSRFSQMAPIDEAVSRQCPP